ncbi:MAG: GNAT family N-acetyltransferase [Acidobacteria bacterium]|nr:GNAT family N-acetyltransferase [Acidobacteriota bacterium]
MPILDLRMIQSRQLDAIFEDAQRLWLDELHWDYRPSLQLIRKFIDSRSLSGYAAFANHQPASIKSTAPAMGYGFYVLEETKALIGDLFVSPQYPQLEISREILQEIMATLQGVPHLERIEAQLIPFGMSLDPILKDLGFTLHTRDFMILPLSEARLESAPISAGMRIDPWNDQYFEACAKLIHLSYVNHVDSVINDQYHSEAGALRFLKNIVVLPGCGQFQPDASFVLRPLASDRLIGAVLTSMVSHGVGHTTQLCVLPGYQGHGLGLRLMEASIRALLSRKFHALTLTVTADNRQAVRLYEGLGFRKIKSFAAAVWKALG